MDDELLRTSVDRTENLLPGDSDDESTREKDLQVTAFAARKVFFFLSLCLMMAIGIWSPSLRADIAFWGIVWQFVYFSLDPEAHLNRPFLVGTHGPAVGLCGAACAVGVYVAAWGMGRGLVDARAERDGLDIHEAMLLHALAYAAPPLLLAADLCWTRPTLRRRYALRIPTLRRHHHPPHHHPPHHHSHHYQPHHHQHLSSPRHSHMPGSHRNQHPQPHLHPSNPHPLHPHQQQPQPTPSPQASQIPLASPPSVPSQTPPIQAPIQTPPQHLEPSHTPLSPPHPPSNTTSGPASASSAASLSIRPASTVDLAYAPRISLAPSVLTSPLAMVPFANPHAALCWILVAPLILVLIWNLASPGCGDVYDVPADARPAFIAVLFITAFLAVLALVFVLCLPPNLAHSHMNPQSPIHTLTRPQSSLQPPHISTR
eukprot:TRINITY_DN9546_c0_g1_i1.p1 TRINITY_DN9546_c0_g1~~TRINITY_DN9546_c0_g1_i1.p1  ORF type:complete len:429 (+),score=65.87 TRINITY_DN9546_c0_g1_i1:78-1364(+)